MKFNWSLLKMFFISMFHPLMILGSFHQLLFQRMGRWPQNKKDYKYNEKIQLLEVERSCISVRVQIMWWFCSTLQRFVNYYVTHLKTCDECSNASIQQHSGLDTISLHKMITLINFISEKLDKEKKYPTISLDLYTILTQGCKFSSVQLL